MAYACLATASSKVEEPLWQQLSSHRAPASVHELHLQTNARPNAIQHRLSRWVRAGFVNRIEGTPKRYVMTEDASLISKPPRVNRAGQASPRERTYRDRLWSAMRVLKSFDLPTLIISSGVSRRSAEDLVNCLTRAGYLKRTSNAGSVRGEWATYSLVRNTGPKSPRVSHKAADVGRRREVVDRNTGERTDISAKTVSLRRRSSADPADGGEG